MSQVETRQPVPSRPSEAPSPAPSDDRTGITPIAAGWFGAALIALTIVCVLLVNLLNPAHSLGSAALTGTAMLLTGLIALVVLSRAVGMVQPTAALGLPHGSVRALLALGLAIVFVSVASWTLGGLFDPLSQQISELKIPTSQVSTILDQYKGDYVIGRTSIPGSSDEIIKVFIKKQNDGSLDIAKQILTIASTVLVTVVGFYFGSQASSDAARTIQTTLLNSRTGPGTVALFDAATTVARDIMAMSADATKRVQALGVDPMAKLADAVRNATTITRETLAKPLSNAQQHFDDFKAAQNEIDEAAKHAAAISDPMKADAADGDLQKARDQLIMLRTKATECKRAFDAALTVFIATSNEILAAASKG